MSDLNIELMRLCSLPDATIGALFWAPFPTLPQGRQFLCFTLEDQAQPGAKVRAETRIPAGRYRLTLRREGGFHQRYGAKFGDAHKGMLWVRDVPGFEWILLHMGNTDDDTEGCILVGDSVTWTGPWLVASEAAYRRVYPQIAREIQAGRTAWLTITDLA